MFSRRMEWIPALPPALAAFALAFALTGCAARQGMLVDLDNGEEIRLHVKSVWGGYEVEGVFEDGRRLKGDLREVRESSVLPASPRWKREHGAPAVDTVYYGSGYLKDGNRVIDFEYFRDKGGSGIGTAKDNEGRRYKLML